MRNSDSPYLADLFAISLRWLVLFGLTISLGTGGALAPPTGKIAIPPALIILSLPALWNGFVSALAIFNRRLPWHRQINVTLDLLFGMLLYISAGGFASGVFWVAMLPILSAAIYFEARGVIFTVALISLFQTGQTYLVSGNHFQILPSGIMSSFNLLTGGVVALLTAPLMGQLRKTYQSTVSQRKESEKKAQRQERDRMRALFSMIETFSSTLNYQTVLETVLETAIAASGEPGDKAEEMVGAVLLFGDRNNLEIRAMRGFLPRDSAITLPADTGGLHDTLKSGEAHLVETPGQDPELSSLLTLQERKAALILPLIRGMSAYGVMLFAHQNIQFFTRERVETLQMLGNQAVIAIQNARLYQDLAREKERLVQSQEEAQKKLARNLHDGPTQSVSAIAMRINIARKMLEKSPGDVPDELARIEELARRTTQEIRHMLFTLRPLVLETEGLEAALQTMADKIHDLYQQKVVIDADPGVVMQLEASRQTVVFYLAEEAINNARKHAQASEIWVRIKDLPNDPCIAILEIVDNGIGFDVQEVLGSYERSGSLGMVNLRERADLINGLLKIDSVPNKGTCIRIYIPLDEAASDRLHQHH